jgi:hypothetical protein
MSPGPEESRCSARPGVRRQRHATRLRRVRRAAARRGRSGGSDRRGPRQLGRIHWPTSRVSDPL